MGRVYTMQPKGAERDGMGHRFFTSAGVPLKMVTHVEFDQDADEGFATVEFIAADVTGSPVLDYEKNEACRCRLRTWIRAVPPGGAEPGPTLLWKNYDGTVSAGDDPLPDVPFTAASQGV